MSNSIREQIIQAIVTKLADITTTNGYNTNIGALVERVRPVFEQDELPATSVIPLPEESVKLYGKLQSTMPVLIEASKLHEAVNPSIVAELILADLIACMTGPERLFSFTSGGTYEIEAGDTITGATSTETALVIEVSVLTGTFAGGDAAGTLRVRSQSGDFVAENLNVGAETNVATIAANSTYIEKLGGLVEEIAYTGGGPDAYPGPGDLVTGCPATFNIRYLTVIGNPYSQ